MSSDAEDVTEGSSQAAFTDGTTGRTWGRLHTPLLVGCWLLGYWAPWQPSRSTTAWLELASWSATHGLHNLQTSSVWLTAAVALCAALGGIFRVAKAYSRTPRNVLGQAGSLLTCAPLCVLLPSSGALLFLIAAVAVSIYGLVTLLASGRSKQQEGSRWRRLVGESFPIFAAVCFVTLSWQYNAQSMMRGLLISAGLSLVVRAVFPVQGGTRS